MPRILLVDDEPRILRFLELRLRLEGHDVVTADCGDKAFALACGTRPEVIVLDTSTSGITEAASLQDLQPFSNVPIIATSTGSWRTGGAVPPGAAAYLAKPFHPDQLVALIREVLEAGTRITASQSA